MTLGRLETDPGAGLRRDINDHLEVVGRRFDQLDRRIDNLDARLDGFGRRLDAVEQRLGRVEERLDGVDGRLDRLEQLVAFVARQHGWTDPDDDNSGEPTPLTW